MRGTLAALTVSVLSCLAAEAAASPTVWTRARRPDIEVREALRVQAEENIKKWSEHVRNTAGEVPGYSDLFLREAQRQLEQAGGERSPDVRVRIALAGVLRDLRDNQGCIRILERVVKETLPAPHLESAWDKLSICYAKVGRRNEEIRAYDALLELVPDSGNRGRLLANRAESRMGLGDLSGAVADYRAALLSNPNAATTYWGLGVALDRSGNLDGALGAIALARSYDRADRDIHLPGWFYTPEYDEAWYMALGSWESARSATLRAARAEHFLRAVAFWEEYVDRAPPDDQYLPIARLRLKQCDKERERDRDRSVRAERGARTR